jgi:hypothetical protein
MVKITFDAYQKSWPRRKCTLPQAGQLEVCISALLTCNKQKGKLIAKVSTEEVTQRWRRKLRNEDINK